MAGAVERLASVVDRLKHYEVDSYFAIDLADVRGMDYYTGITFKAYTTTSASRWSMAGATTIWLDTSALPAPLSAAPSTWTASCWPAPASPARFLTLRPTCWSTPAPAAPTSA